MVSFTRKLIDLLPSAPRKRFNIFAGTNTAREWGEMLRVWLSGGPYDDEEIIREYEREFAAVCGVRHAISFGSGRMALYAILQALDIDVPAVVTTRSIDFR